MRSFSGSLAVSTRSDTKSDWVKSKLQSLQSPLSGGSNKKPAAQCTMQACRICICRLSNCLKLSGRRYWTAIELRKRKCLAVKARSLGRDQPC